MGEARNFSVRTVRLAGLIVMTGLLAACEEGIAVSRPDPATSGTETGQSEAVPARKGEARDVEAPDVFSVSEAGLWDGRPSLGGVWVAHPDVSSPERVVIRNTSNGKSVTGALFRRERDVPGPRLQASSDAAAELGMLAGAPVKLSVVALRREEPKVTAVPALSTAETPEPAASPAAVATAAVRPQARAGAQATEQAAGSATTEAAAEPAAREPFFKRVFGAKPDKGAEAAKPETTAKALETAKPVAVSELPAASSAAAPAAAAPVAAEAAPEAPKPRLKDLFKPKDKPVGEPLTALAPVTAPVAAAETAAPPPKPMASNLSKPFIQIGTFSTKDNADRAASQIRGAGMIPEIKTETSNSKQLWRVLVGPATSADDRATLLKKVRGAGFNDAFAVTR